MFNQLGKKIGELAHGFKTLLIGMGVTLKNFRQAPVTLQYPWVREELPVRSRGLLRMWDFFGAKSIDDRTDEYPGSQWAPCTNGCPAHTDARGYVSLAGEGKFKEGYALLKMTYPWSGTLGRVCPAPCEKVCTMGIANPEPIAIRRLKRFYADYEFTLPEDERIDYRKVKQPSNGTKIAIIGSGPAGIQAAWELALMGFECAIFEKKAIPGGFISLGIPLYRLPRSVIEYEVAEVLKMGVELRCGVEIGKDLTLDDLRQEGFKEIIACSGAWKGIRIGIPDDQAPGVMVGEDWLEEVITGTRTEVPPKVVVIGGGNTGYDCSRSSKRLGADVTLIYRRTRKEMNAEKEEIEEALEEGIHHEFLTSPLRVVLDEKGHVKGLECVRNRLGDRDKSGRRSPVPIEGSNFILECELILTALGRTCEAPYLPAEVKRNRNGTIVVDKEYHTSVPDIWAAGDNVKVSTIIQVIADAKACVQAIGKKYKCYYEQPKDLWPTEGWNPPTPGHPRKEWEKDKMELPIYQPSVFRADEWKPWEHLIYDKPFQWKPLQVPMPKQDEHARIHNFDEVELGFTPEMAMEEGSRCLACDSEACIGCGICVDACPDAVITLKSGINEEGKYFPLQYNIDMNRCCYCGLCTEACPTKSLFMSNDYELSSTVKTAAYMNKERMVVRNKVAGFTIINNPPATPLVGGPKVPVAH